MVVQNYKVAFSYEAYFTVYLIYLLPFPSCSVVLSITSTLHEESLCLLLNYLTQHFDFCCSCLLTVLKKKRGASKKVIVFHFHRLLYFDFGLCMSLVFLLIEQHFWCCLFDTNVLLIE